MKAERMMSDEERRASASREAEVMAGRNESERRLSPEVAEAKDRLIGTLSGILPYARLEQMSPKEVFEAYYRDYLDEAGTFDNFKSLLVKYGEEADRAKYLDLSKEELDKDEEAVVKYRKYLLRKLPMELQEKEAGRYDGDEDQIPLARLEKLAGAGRMFAGFHVSDHPFEDSVDISRIQSSTVSGGETVDVPPGYAHYSATPGSLYGRKKYLYIVEGSRGDLETGVGKKYNEASRKRGCDWAATARKLPILERLELTDDLAKELELGFV